MLVKDFYEVLYKEWSEDLSINIKNKDKENIQRSYNNVINILGYCTSEISELRVSQLNGLLYFVYKLEVETVDRYKIYKYLKQFQIKYMGFSNENSSALILQYWLDNRYITLDETNNYLIDKKFIRKCKLSKISQNI